MAWNSTSPDGTKSVKANVIIQQQNTTYTQNILGDILSNTEPAPGSPTRDHFWNIGNNEDGHHRQVQMMNYADTYTGAPADPTLSPDMTAAIYAKLFGAESQPMYRNAAGLMEILGIRACAVFNVSLVNPFPISIIYSHNVTSVTKTGSSPYVFTCNFTAALPSANYLVLGGGVGFTGSGRCDFQMATGATISSAKTTALTNFGYLNSSNLSILPIQGWIVMFGG